jgi:hypothetical protein
VVAVPYVCIVLVSVFTSNGSLLDSNLNSGCYVPSLCCPNSFACEERIAGMKNQGTGDDVWTGGFGNRQLMCGVLFLG